MILVLSGPPKAGKSRLRGEIYRLLREWQTEAQERGGPSPRWFVEVASPDSEGQWVSDAHAHGMGDSAEALARRIKQSIKESGEFFSPAFVERKRRQIEGLARFVGEDGVLVLDIGGFPSRENRALLSGLEGLHPIVLTREGGEDAGWQGFWAGFGRTPLYVGPYREDLALALLSFAREAEVARFSEIRQEDAPQKGCWEPEL